MPRPMTEVHVTVEVPRGSFIKRTPGGAIDYVSPLPSPFNYGSVAGQMAADGDPLDALILGPRLALGAKVVARVWGEVDFVDAGDDDPKLVCTLGPPPRSIDWLRVRAFFAVYAQFKVGLHAIRGREGVTRVRSISRR